MDDAGKREINAGGEMLVDVGDRPVAHAGTVVQARRVAPHSYGPRSLLWLLLLLVAATAALAVYFARGRSGESDSLAILPFSVGGGDTETEVIADGIRETLTNTLSRLPHVRIIAAGSMSRFKPGPADPERVGRELGVRTVVTGHVLQQGDTLAIDAELVRVADGARLWSGSFIRPLSDIFLVEEELAGEIVQQLRPRLPAADRGVLRSRATDNLAAYRLYLKGRYHWNERTAKGLEDAIAFFKQATATDSAYALAYAALADCYALLGDAEYGMVTPLETMPKARAAAQRALEIDPGLAGAHAVLGLVQWTFDRDRVAAERSLRRAIELAPADATAHRWYAEMLAESGRGREAGAEIRRALDLDPLSPSINADLGLFAYYTRDYDQAIDAYKATLAMEPHFVAAQLGLALAYAQQKLYREAFAQLDRARGDAPGEPGVLAATGYVLGRAGKRTEARAVSGELQRLSEHRFVAACDIARVLLGAGDSDAALDWLERACKERSSLLGTLAVDPAFDPVRGVPRFAAVLRCAGLGR